MGARLSLQGQDSTLGLSLNESMPAECDSVLVQVLKLQGAVPFVHTNIPQSMFRLDGVQGGGRGAGTTVTWPDPFLLPPAMTAVTPSLARP